LINISRFSGLPSGRRGGERRRGKGSQSDKERKCGEGKCCENGYSTA